MIAATEASSADSGMPRAAIQRDEIVDYVVPVDEIAGLLMTLVAEGADVAIGEAETA